MQFNALTVGQIFKAVEEAKLQNNHFPRERLMEILSHGVVSSIGKPDIEKLRTMGYSVRKKPDLERLCREEILRSAEALFRPEGQPKGIFIVMEGMDRTGKSTQIYGSSDRTGEEFRGLIPLKKYLEGNMPGRTSMIMEQPSYDDLLGLMVASVTGSRKPKVNVEKADFGEFGRYVYMAWSLNRALQLEKIRDILNSGGWVLSNRGKQSNWVYQSLFNGVDIQKMQKVEENFPNGMVIYMRVPQEEVEQLYKKREDMSVDRDSYERGIETQMKIAAKYDELAERFNWYPILCFKNGQELPANEKNKRIREVIDSILKSTSL